jgi:DNA polymerase IV
VTRTIIHLDLDAFFCAVEEQRDGSLRGTAFAVGGRPEERGVVASCSYAARRFGVRSALPMARALALCPQLVIVPPRHREYRAVSRQVMALLRALTPLVEPISIDEAFLDVSEHATPGLDLARQLQQTIRAELGLPCSLGIATNKLVAKVATDVGKAASTTGDTPNAIQVVPPGEEAAFLAPLPASALWGVGPKTAERLALLGLRTIGDIAAWPADDLARRFGSHGEDLARRARGVDSRPVVTTHEAKSISHETTFAQDVAERERLRAVIGELARKVGARARQKGVSGTTVSIKLRWPDFVTITRQTTLAKATDQDRAIVAAALRLFDEHWPAGQPLRLVGVGLDHLSDGPRQRSLFERSAVDDPRIQEAVAKLKARFGSDALRRGSDLQDE